MKKIFTNLFLLATLFLASTNLTAQTYNNGTWYSLYDTNEKTKSTNTGGDIASYSAYTPSTGVFSLETKMDKAGWINPDSYELTVDGQTISVGSKQTSYTTKNTTINTNSSSLTVSYTYKFYNATRTVYIKNIKLPLAKHILLADGTSFGTTSITTQFANPVNINETSSALTVKLRSFLTTGNINITSDNPAFYVATSTYGVGANACASANGAAGVEARGDTLGDINKYDVLIHFHPTSAGTHNGTITLTDGISTATIKVSGICKKQAQTITWNDDIANIQTTDNITLNATATTAITYTSSDNSIAEIVGNTLKINKHGKVTITATAAETDIYASATQTKEVTISATVPEVTSWPQVAPITYGTPLTLDMLEGGTANVPGNFEFADFSTTLNADTTHNLVVRFIPENQNIYATVEDTISVVVNKADQTIAWDFTITEMTVDEVLTLSATATAGDVTFDLTGDAATLEGNTLTAVKAGEVVIKASQAGNKNYNAAEEVAHTITINKATPTVTAWPTINNVVYGATYSEALQLVGGEASVKGTFSIINMPDDLTQVPTVDTYTFEVIFTPTKTDCYNTLQNSVTLTVTKELQTITWDFADQEVLIGTTLNLNATATSGEVTFSIKCEEGVASLEGNTVTALKAGVVTITASVSNENYEPATVSHVVTVIKHTPEITTLPTVDPIGYDTPLTNDLLMGGETTTEGTWEFVNPDQELQMGDNEVVIRFIPNNAEHYSPIEITIIITVEKATTTISWEKINSDDLYKGGYLGLYAEASSGVEISYTVTAPEGVLEYDSELGVYFISGYGTITITAHAEETETHKAAEMTQEVTLYDPDSNPSTNITNTTINGEKAQKIFVNGKLYIIRNNQWYDTTGKLVK